MQARFSNRTRRAANWLVALWLIVALPVFGLSAAITGALGPAHFHAASSAKPANPDLMAGWQDFRRSDHIADSGFHAHSHDGLNRHYHEAADASVVAIGSDGHEDGPGDGASAATLPLVFAASEARALSGSIEQLASADWPVTQVGWIRSRTLPRLDRPPKP